MRRLARVVLLCLGCGLCSLLYGFSQLALSLEQEAPRRHGDSAFPVRRQLSGGDTRWGAVAGSAGRGERERRSGPERYDFPKPQLSETMHLAVVACGERLEETVTMLKSAIIFSIKSLQFHIFAEESLHSDFREILDNLAHNEKFNYTLYPISFPTENAAEWKKLFKPCASQRLFLPLILSNVDSLLYVDTDILLLRPVDDIWSFLKKFNSTQIAAMAPEHEEPRIGWYNRFARHPYYGKTGINSGVMLMNMTRIRRKYFKNDMTSVQLRWEDILMPLLKKYKLNITWGDQDLLNIMFFHNPESLFVFPCQWNYRPDHCIYGSNCQEAEKEGIFILHGNRGVYHDDKQPTFRAVYDAIKNKFQIAAQDIILLKEIPSKILRARKDFNFLTLELKTRQISFRWEIPLGIVVTFAGTKYKLNSVQKAKDFYLSVLKADIPPTLLSSKVQEELMEQLVVDLPGAMSLLEDPQTQLKEGVPKEQRITRAAYKRKEKERQQKEIESIVYVLAGDPVGSARPKRSVTADLQGLLNKLHKPKDG